MDLSFGARLGSLTQVVELAPILEELGYHSHLFVDRGFADQVSGGHLFADWGPISLGAFPVGDVTLLIPKSRALPIPK